MVLSNISVSPGARLLEKPQSGLKTRGNFGAALFSPCKYIYLLLWIYLSLQIPLFAQSQSTHMTQVM